MIVVRSVNLINVYYGFSEQSLASGADMWVAFFLSFLSLLRFLELFFFSKLLHALMIYDFGCYSD